MAGRLDSQSSLLAQCWANSSHAASRWLKARQSAPSRHKNTTNIPCVTDPMHFNTLVYFKSTELGQPIRSPSNMNINWYSEQKTVGNTGVS